MSNTTLFSGRYLTPGDGIQAPRYKDGTPYTAPGPVALPDGRIGEVRLVEPVDGAEQYLVRGGKDAAKRFSHWLATVHVGDRILRLDVQTLERAS